MPAMAILVDERGSLLRGDAAGPGPPQLFQGQGDGAYTAALLTGSPLSIIDWELHEKRLIRSIAKLSSMNQQQPGEQSESGGAEAGEIMQLVNQRVAAATAAYAESSEPVASTEQAPHTAKLFVHVSAPANGKAVRVVVYCAPLQQPPQDVPVKVAVIGPPRDAALASTKYSKWIQERRYLEEKKPAGMSELLLCDDEGGITEGLVSNFCVIADCQDGRGDVLMTAGPSQPALQGIFLCRVLQACANLQLPIVHKAPRIEDRRFWKEAFISNCLRGLQPVSSVSCPIDNFCGQAEWELELPHAHGPITRRLQASVLEVQVHSPITQLCVVPATQHP